MRVLDTDLPGVRVVEPSVFRDPRGALIEMWNQTRHVEGGLMSGPVLDLVSISDRGVVRGLHYQRPFAQAKLVSVLEGEVYDVALDIRHGSPHFGRWTSATLSAENARQLFIPRGFAHGYAVVSERAVLHYKVDDHYHPEAEAGVAWDDPDVAIPWPIPISTVSDRDRAHPRLRDVPVERLPRFDEGEV
jgi:dTDP-4-dehydrorhamnose 3,5-epimerase